MDQRIPNIINKGKPSDGTESQKNKEFLSLFHQSDIEFELKNQLLEDLNQTEANTTNKQYFDALFEKIWQKRRIELKDTKSKTHLFLRFAQLAAILAVGLFIGYFLNWRKKLLHRFITPLLHQKVQFQKCISPMERISI